MLVLSRKVGETVVIGDIRITVVDILNNSRVRLGFVASPDTKIMREELLTKEKEDAAVSPTSSPAAPAGATPENPDDKSRGSAPA